MNGNNTPSPLNAKLLKESSSHNASFQRHLKSRTSSERIPFVPYKAIWIQERSTDDAHDDNGEATAKSLRS